jgi:hypothetical protein
MFVIQSPKSKSEGLIRNATKSDHISLVSIDIEPPPYLHDLLFSKQCRVIGHELDDSIVALIKRRYSDVDITSLIAHRFIWYSGVKFAEVFSNKLHPNSRIKYIENEKEEMGIILKIIKTNKKNILLYITQVQTKLGNFNLTIAELSSNSFEKPDEYKQNRKIIFINQLLKKIIF